MAGTKEGRVMEYLIAIFEDDRQVIIDKKPQGRTNQVIEVESGTHTVTLEKPPFDFQPKEITLILASHDLERGLALADHAAILDQGQLVDHQAIGADGSDTVREAYAEWVKGKATIRR